MTTRDEHYRDEHRSKTDRRKQPKVSRFKRDEQTPNAKKGTLTLETRSVVSLVVESSRRCVSTMVNTAWEREEVSFMFVAATVLCGGEEEWRVKFGGKRRCRTVHTNKHIAHINRHVVVMK